MTPSTQSTPALEIGKDPALSARAAGQSLARSQALREEESALMALLREKRQSG